MNVRVLGAVLLAAVLVGGCSSEAEEPRTLPPVTAAPSASPSQAAAVPPSAAAQTPQAAAAFARFFYAEVGKAFGERDPSRVEALSAPGCQACQLFISSIAELRDKDQRVSPVDFKIVFAEAPGIEGEQARVDVIYNLAPVRTTDATGKSVAEDPGAQNREVQLTLVRAGGSWLVKAAEAV